MSRGAIRAILQGFAMGVRRREAPRDVSRILFQNSKMAVFRACARGIHYREGKNVDNFHRESRTRARQVVVNLHSQVRCA